MIDWVETISGTYIASNANSGGLDKPGLIATIIISIIVIAAVVWLFHGTKKRD